MPKADVEMIPWAPRAPGKKLQLKLACDAGSSGPDFVSVRSQVIEASYQLPELHKCSMGKTSLVFGALLVSHPSCQPLEVATTAVVLSLSVTSLRKAKAAREEKA